MSSSRRDPSESELPRDQFGLQAAYVFRAQTGERQVSLVVTNGTVVTMDGGGRVIANGAIAVDGADIVAVDHVNGIDDLRIFSVRQGRPLPLYGPEETLHRLRSSFNYIFDDAARRVRGR